jgi:hypothetical protein
MYTLNRKTPVLERLSRLYGMAAFLIAFAHAQTPPQGYMLHGYATLPIRATADGSMEGTWRIISANLSENLATTWGILAIQNISGSPISQARFYAEYYDSAGNMCMTMVFAGEANEYSTSRRRHRRRGEPGIAHAFSGAWSRHNAGGGESSPD